MCKPVAWPLPGPLHLLSKFLMEILLGLPRRMAQGPGTPSSEKVSPRCQGRWYTAVESCSRLHGATSRQTPGVSSMLPVGVG